MSLAALEMCNTIHVQEAKLGLKVRKMHKYISGHLFDNLHVFIRSQQMLLARNLVEITHTFRC